MDHSQQLVESLQEDLASSKGRCDGLQRVVREGREGGEGEGKQALIRRSSAPICLIGRFRPGSSLSSLFLGGQLREEVPGHV